MRTFVGVDIGESIREEIQAIRSRLGQAGADVKWVEQNNTHLTMKFIGEIGPDQVRAVSRALEDAARGCEPFKIEIRGVGTFPRRRPRVLWVGIENPSGALARLHKAIENALAELGIEKENRKFSPHITLGRVRSGKKVPQLLDALDAEQPAELGGARVESLILFESKLTPKGPRYTRLAEAILPKKGERVE